MFDEFSSIFIYILKNEYIENNITYIPMIYLSHNIDRIIINYFLKLLNENIK